jgi:hypothetical protein
VVVAILVRIFILNNNRMNEQVAINFLNHFSLLTVGENKRPNYPWSKLQETKQEENQFLKQFNYKGGIIKKDGDEIPATTGIGIITGFDFLEVIDIDTKVFSTQLEMNDFWSEYLQTLKDTIINFDKKFVIYKTKSGGYHILYKSKRCLGNVKIAKLKGHKEAIIETRGKGGYVFVYPDNKVSEKSYFEIDFITDEDRESLWRISKSYNFEETQPKIETKVKKEYVTGNITPWEDFNNNNEIWTVIQDDFSIPTNGQKRNHYLIKRFGATSDHSGYVYRDSGCMFLFSTGTCYPAETLISPYSAYTYKLHGGDFSASARDLYDQGFGSRIKAKIDEIKPVIEDYKPVIDEMSFPLDVFPKDIQYYITECNDKLDSNLDYMGVSLMWLISVCVGNSMRVEVKKGWYENGVLWVAVVGKAGIGKTPSINNVIFPLMKENSKEIKRYIKDKEVEDHYNKLDKKEKASYPEPKPAIKTQFVANDITLEALVDLHQQSDNSVGVFKDELAGWLKDMNKYRAGSDLEFWLSTWSSKSVNLNRMTRAGSFVEKPFIPVLGGIQPSIFNSFSTDENKENGFMDRMLLSFPDAEVDLYNENELDADLINWYGEIIKKFYQGVKGRIYRNGEGDIEQETIKFSIEAKKEWKIMFNEITNKQNNDEENEYLKSMYPKQKSYIPRFALLIHTFNNAFVEGNPNIEISKNSILKAKRLSDYFVNNARKIKLESAETQDIKSAFGKAETTLDKLTAIYKKDKDFNKTKVAELLGVSRRTIQRTIQQIEKK